MQCSANRIYRSVSTVMTPRAVQGTSRAISVNLAAALSVVGDTSLSQLGVRACTYGGATIRSRGRYATSLSLGLARPLPSTRTAECDARQGGVRGRIRVQDGRHTAPARAIAVHSGGTAHTGRVYTKLFQRYSR